MGTRITLLRRRSESPDWTGVPICKGEANPDDEAETKGVDARHVPTINWYENRNARPLNVGGRFVGKSSVYESDLARNCSSELALARERARTTPALACGEGQIYRQHARLRLQCR
jgi:hypothetical protein